ncbi:hypothetical protein HHK36_019551 [Tetracentron sinense]|uniref:Aminotransferase-like plant mobile domain-containing protein n=1 Tax=Tetracentron sinense TaxID=13715 RepID=A0A834Z1H9_TETSI|nr:hypothetical protein HHK36_019551 [Tetracentron sinense]
MGGCYAVSLWRSKLGSSASSIYRFIVKDQIGPLSEFAPISSETYLIGETVAIVGDHDPALMKYFDCTRSSHRSAFDGNVVYQFEIMEYKLERILCFAESRTTVFKILDYGFVRMGADGSQVNRPFPVFAFLFNIEAGYGGSRVTLDGTSHFKFQQITIVGIIVFLLNADMGRPKKVKTRDSSSTRTTIDEDFAPLMEVEEQSRENSQVGVSSSWDGATSSRGRKKKPTFSSLPVVPEVLDTPLLKDLGNHTSAICRTQEVLLHLSAISTAGLMGVLPESIAADNACEAGKVKLSWLTNLLDNKDVTTIDINSPVFTGVLRTFLLYVLGAYFFMTDCSYVDSSFLSLMDHVDRSDTFDWGGAIYASILVGLCRVSRGEGRSMGAQEYLDPFRLSLRVPDITSFPRSSQWKAPSSKVDSHLLEKAREELDCLTLRRVSDSSATRPYAELGDMILLLCRGRPLLAILEEDPRGLTKEIVVLLALDMLVWKCSWLHVVEILSGEKRKEPMNVLLTEYQPSYKELEERITSLLVENEGLKTEVAKMGSEATAYQDRIKDLKAQVDILKTVNEEFQYSQNPIGGKNSTGQEVILKLNVELARLRQKLKDHQGEVSSNLD